MSQPIFAVRNLAVAINDPQGAGLGNDEGLLIEPFGPRLPPGWVNVVQDVSFSIGPEEALGIVGESGCGKTLTVMGSLGLLGAGAKVTRGEVFFDGTRIRPTRTQARRWAKLRRRTTLKSERSMEELSDESWRRIMGTEIGMLFQDALGSWNPVQTAGRQAGEALDAHSELSRQEIRKRVLDAFGEVQLPREAKYSAFPNELSRGQAQRGMLAAALIKGPRLLVADEPLTGLDSVVAAAVLSLIRDMQQKRKMAMVFASHDLAQVAALATKVVVMCGGRIIESGPVDSVFRQPQHPYTAGLLGALPRSEAARLHPIPGDIPRITDIARNRCVFLGRCAYATAGCSQQVPPLLPAGLGEVACIRHAELDLRGV